MNKENDLKALEVQKKVFALTMQGREVNSFSAPKETARSLIDGGILYVNDIKYSDEYPNSFLDIWYTNENIKEKRPTFIHIHGGGNLFGDKVAGDPLAKEVKGDLSYYKDLARRGYNVVSINYCFSPDYRAPAQIIQVNCLFAYLIANAEKLGLDMNNVILGGGSAGANYTAIYGLALCDKEYAKKLGFVPAIRKEAIKALVIDEMCLTSSAILTSPNMIILTSVWLGTTEGIGKCELSLLLDVTENIKADYIPSYITASNVEKQFEMSASPLKEKLTAIGVDNEMYYVPKAESEELTHGFMANFSANKYSKECYEKMLAFIGKYL